MPMIVMMTSMITPSTVRTRADRRHNNIKKAIRKQKIAKSVYPGEGESWNYYDNLHQYSKNKIHCSCYSCSCKTRDKKKKYAPTLKERRRMNEMEYEIREIIGGTI